MSYSPGSNAAADYRRLHLETDVAQASPNRLIQMLLQRLLLNLVHAEQAMQGGVTNRKGELISDAISIIDCLRTSLNFDAGGRVAENLNALYDYMTRRLLLANMHDDADVLREVIGLVTEIKDAWDAISDR